MNKIFNAMQNFIYGDARLILTEQQLKSIKNH